jgi:hypothetical protein
MMKKLWVVALATLGLTAMTQADVVFSEDFDGQTVTEATEAYFGGVTTPNVTTGEWFSSTSVITSNDKLELQRPARNKSRGGAIWLDSSGWDAGTVTVEVDILDYVAGEASSVAYFEAYYANGVGATEWVMMDVHNGTSDPLINSSAGATIGAIGGSQNMITANVTDTTFTFDFTGQENIALVFYGKGDGGYMPTYSVDNLSVTTIPEPATLGMVCGVGVAVLFIRRRLAM